MTSSDECVIFDVGSFSIKAGLSSEISPRADVRSLVAISPECNRDNYDEFILGDAIFARISNPSDACRISFPVEEGFIENIDHLEMLLEYTYKKQLMIDSSNFPVIFAEPHFNPPKLRSKTCEIFFEQFQVPEINFSLQGVLCLVGTGRITGLVVDCGHASTCTVPVFESYVLAHSINRLKLGGRHVDIGLAKLLASQGIATLAKSSDTEILRKVKEEHCFCRENKFDVTRLETQPVSLNLPDGNKTLDLGDELWQVSEGLFYPSVFSLESVGVAQAISDCVKKSPMDLTKPLLCNIVLCGGTAQLKGFNRRVSNEVKALVSAKASRDVNVVTIPSPAYAAWTGGKVFASLKDGFSETWMSREEYFEFGPDYLQQKTKMSE